MKIEKLLPLKVKDVRKGIGSFITFNLQNNYLLWVYLTDWKILDFESSEVLLDSDLINDYNCLDLFNSLASCSLESFILEDNIVKFRFDDKYLLFLSANLDEYESSDELFMFFGEKEHKVISFSPEKKLYLENQI